MSLISKYGLTIYKEPLFVSNGKTISIDVPEYSVESGGGTYDYLAFPALAISDTGKLYTVYRQGSDHNITADGAITMRTSTDNGVTWGASVDLVARDGSTFHSNPNIAVTSTGRIIVTYSINTNSGEQRVIWVITSDNDGGTWSSPSKMTDIYEPDGQISGVGCDLEYVKATNTLLMTFFARPTNAGKRAPVIFSSTDNGDTWAFYSNIRPIEAEDFEEPQFVLTPTGMISCLLRSDVENASFYTYSLDGGLNWSRPVQVIDSVGKNPIGVSPDSTLLSLGRHSIAGGDFFRATISNSQDEGATWNTQFLTDRGEAYMYGGVVWSAVIDKFIIVWSVEVGTPFTGSCDLICKHISEVDV